MGQLISGVANPQGGITPEQAQWARFSGAEQDIGNAAAFGSHGMGMSTGLTQADAGAGFGTALFGEQLSRADANAAQNYLNQQKGSLSTLAGNLGNVLPGGA